MSPVGTLSVAAEKKTSNVAEGGRRKDKEAPKISQHSYNQVLVGRLPAVRAAVVPVKSLGAWHRWMDSPVVRHVVRGVYSAGCRYNSSAGVVARRISHRHDRGATTLLLLSSSHCRRYVGQPASCLMRRNGNRHQHRPTLPDFSFSSINNMLLITRT